MTPARALHETGTRPRRHRPRSPHPSRWRSRSALARGPLFGAKLKGCATCLLVFFATLLGVWLRWQPPRRRTRSSAAPLCDARAATTFGPAPLIMAPETSMDIPGDDGTCMTGVFHEPLLRPGHAPSTVQGAVADPMSLATKRRRPCSRALRGRRGDRRGRCVRSEWRAKPRRPATAVRSTRLSFVDSAVADRVGSRPRTSAALDENLQQAGARPPS